MFQAEFGISSLGVFRLISEYHHLVCFRLNSEYHYVVCFRLYLEYHYLVCFRLFSEYHYFGKYPKSPEDFHQQVEEQVISFRSCLKEKSLRACAYPSDAFPVSEAAAEQLVRNLATNWEGADDPLPPPPTHTHVHTHTASMA